MKVGMKVVYVAGPFRAKTPWEQEQNVRRAEAASLEIWRMGAVAICPHTQTRFFQDAAPDRVWLDGTLEMMRRCDAIFLCDGWEDSAGSKNEVEWAKDLGMPAFIDLKHLRAWSEGAL